MKKLKRGVLVVFEGIDGSGKTTMQQRLAHHLQEQQISHVCLMEPTNGFWGQRIRQGAREGRPAPYHEMVRFLFDRQENVKKNIKPALEAGKVILLDRYYVSSIAYQGARGIPPEFIREENEKIAVPADLIFLLEIDPETGLKRIEKNRTKHLDLFEQLEELRRVKAIFDQLQLPGLIRINAKRKVDEVYSEIFNHFRQFLEQYLEK